VRAAVTGGSGFIGRNLVNALVDKGHSVRVLTRHSRNRSLINREADLFTGDLLDEKGRLYDFLEDIDILYHCAAVLNEDSSMAEVNTAGTKKLLEIASKRIKHWVQLSSVGVYGQYCRGVVVETDMADPLNLYEKTKAEADRLVMKKSLEGGFTYSILRPSNVYGNDMGNQSLFKMIEAVKRGVFFYIGNKDAVANYIHVNNVAHGLILCGERKEAENEIFNISDRAKLETVINVIAETVNRKKPELILPEQPVRWMAKCFANWKKWPLTETRIDALTNSTVYSNEKLETVLKYKHIISIEEGFTQLTDCWKKELSKPR